jgi:carbamoyltransferase
MNVLGISGRERDAAAALTVSGRLVAAAAEESFSRVPSIGYRMSGGLPHQAIKACLEAAGLKPADVQQVTIVEDGDGGATLAGRNDLAAASVGSISADHADAVQAAGAAPGVDAVIICGLETPIMRVFGRDDGRLVARSRIDGIEDLARGTRRLADVLGVSTTDALAGLDRLSVGAEPAYQTDLARAFHWDSGSSSVRTDADELGGLLTRIAGSQLVALSDATSLNARVNEMRRELAASFACQLADVVSEAAESAANTLGASTLAAGGSLFANARFNTELAGRLRRDMAISAVPERSGRAIGASLAPRPGAPADPGMALGPSFSDEEIKRTLDNCRMDYVYEPDWPRLNARVSRLLVQGKVIAWFQGSMAFGPRALGSRSILCDPSHRYARQNVNEYLRLVPVDEPLPVVFAASAVEKCLVTSGRFRGGVRDVEVQPEWRTQLAGALDWRRRVRVHGFPSEPAARLNDLLEGHFSATGVPGLIETNLAGPGEPVACTPRDAVRTVYSSAVDALVIGRFLLMKDYWLLRSQDA